MRTRLDVINDMIVSTGARPLLAGQDRHPSYLKADQLLERVVSSVLARGLWFNTEIREIQPTTNGEILVPIGCIKAESLGRDYNVSLRGTRMYNLAEGTYEIGNSMRLRMYFSIPFEEIPLSAQLYVGARATYEYYLDDNGADPKLSHYRSLRDETWTTLWQEHINSKKVNSFSNGHSTARRLRRGHTANGGWF